MPPYGLISLVDRPFFEYDPSIGITDITRGVNIPEELAARGYGEDILYDYDPAFGTLRTTERYQPAPFTGARPFQALYDISPRTISGGVDFGFDANLFNPSFGGVSGYRDTDGIMGIMQEEDEEDQLPYSGVGDMRYQTPRTIADQNRILGQTFTEQKPSGIARLFEVLGNIPTPMNILRGGLQSLQGFNQRLRQSDFGQSQNLMEYLGKRRARKEAERLAPIQRQLQEASDRGGGYQPTSREQNVARTESRVSGGKSRAYGL